MNPAGFATRAAPDWPPTCPWCEWVGEPNDEQSPYIWCHRKQANHRRPPVRALALVVAPQAVDSPVDRPAAVTYPTAPPRRPGRKPATTPAPPKVEGPRRPNRPVIGRGDCAACGRPFTLRPGADGPVITRHRLKGIRCDGSENPPKPGTERPA
jgi:hypothetical protein